MPARFKNKILSVRIRIELCDTLNYCPFPNWATVWAIDLFLRAVTFCPIGPRLITYYGHFVRVGFCSIHSMQPTVG